MSEITFRASITKVDGKAPPQSGVPTASLNLAGSFPAEIVEQLYSWADGNPVHVTVWREEEHQQLNFDTLPPPEETPQQCPECDGLGFDHSPDCTKKPMETATAVEAFLKE